MDQQYNFDIPGEPSHIADWTSQFDGICINNGDVFPPDFANRRDGISLSGKFIVAACDKRFFVAVRDLDWHRYDDEDCDQEEEPRGFNLIATKIINLDESEYIGDLEEENDEQSSWQGLADGVACALNANNQWPNGYWSDVKYYLIDNGIV